MLRGRACSVRGGIAAAAALLACAAQAPAAGAQLVPGVEPQPIPQNPLADPVAFRGAPAEPRPVTGNSPVPRHPHMAPNGVSNLHNDAYQSDAYEWGGPRGRDTATDSAFFAHECASITFDSRGRLVTICVGLEAPVLALLDPETLTPLATHVLPPRMPAGAGNPFTDFSGGGYFYLDRRDRAVAVTTTRHIQVIRQTPGPGFEVVRDYDLTGAVGLGDKLISALPDWDGRIWFASTEGVVGWVGRRSGRVRSLDLAEPIGNSFAVDEKGAVYVVSDVAMYRLRAAGGEVETQWRRRYPNDGVLKPGQTQAGSGTTPTLLANGRLVAITDNDDPVHVVVYRRAVDPARGRVVCRRPLFREGRSATDQSLVAAGRAIVAENNHGYSIAATENGGTTTPGLQRVDVNRRLEGCRTVWRSRERAPSVVPKLSLADGLVYTYTKPPSGEGEDAWYLTALDFRTGETVFKRLAGEGLGYNNNYAPVTIAPDSTAYVGVLGGVTMFRDAR